MSVFSDLAKIPNDLPHTILAVDDDPANLSLLTDYLKDFGLRLIVARDGESALEKARYGRPDLILLDLLMPKMDGFETCRRLKADEELKSIPVIFMTALSETTDKVKGFQAGGVDYITKPFQQEEVLARIRTHLTLYRMKQQLEVRNLLLQQEIAGREEAEKALKQNQEELERRVEERTVELAAANRMLHILSEGNQSLVRVTDESRLLNDICRIIVEIGGYPLAWVGFALQDEAKTIRPMAHAGSGERFLGEIRITWADEPAGRGPTGEAIRTGKPVVVADIEQASSTVPWREQAVRHGFRSVISLPLRGEQDVMGVLNICSDKTDAFHAREQDLLMELANDLAYGLTALRTREQRIRAETEQARLQAQLLQAQKLESIGRLAGGIAHDFNNLLTPILGYAEMLRSDLPPDHPLRQAVQDMTLAAERARSLTHQLLAFSRKQVLELNTIDVRDVWRRMEPMLRHTVRENIVLDVAMSDAECVVRADVGQLEQVLMNLTINACDAMPSGGHLGVRVENMDLQEAPANLSVDIQPGMYVQLTVSDTGVGMAPDTVVHIFEPFFSTKETGKGTGLGLSTVYGIVRQHGGAISVDSTPGHGSVFTVYLPRILEPARDIMHAHHPTAITGGTETILILEDDPMVKKLARTVLERLGYRVMEAEHASQCLEMAEQARDSIDLLLTDIVLPKEDGKEVFRRMKAVCPRLKVLFMSGYTNDIIGPDDLPEADRNFIQKPLSINLLAEKVREALDQTKQKAEG